jgi:hemoglobin-like flavoprotein
MCVTMTPDQLQILQKSIDQLDPLHSQFSRSFHYRLIETVPELAQMFADDGGASWRAFIHVYRTMASGNQRSFLSVPVTRQGARELSLPGIRALAQHFVRRGVRPDHLLGAKAALLDCLSLHLQDSFDQRTADAWTAACDVISDSIISLLRADAVEAALPNSRGRTHAGSHTSIEMLFSV